MKKIIKINDLYDEARVDRWLKRNFSSLTQSFIEKILRKGIIKINNKKIKSNYRVLTGDTLSIYNFSDEIFYNNKKNKSIKKINDGIIKNFKKSILYENNDFIILNKWFGISSQAGTKINISIDDIIKFISPNQNLVHRLDKDTSGLMIIAKNLKSTKIFGNLFKNKQIKKIYVALCDGVPKRLISLVNLNIKNKKLINDEIKTITQYKLIQNKNKISLILFKPITGRTHQLRIVSKHINCPIIGDKKYNNNNRFKSEYLKLNACYLNFIFKEKEYEFFSNLSDDFIKFMKKNNFINIAEMKKVLLKSF